MNPRAATNDLLPFQGSPFGQLGYFSKKNDRRLIYMICSDLSSLFFTYKTHPRGAFLYVRKEHFANTQKKSYRYLPIRFKRRGWDSNPRALADKRFSRPPRYDHFDTSPYSVSSLFVLCRSRQVVYYHMVYIMSTLFQNFFKLF